MPIIAWFCFIFGVFYLNKSPSFLEVYDIKKPISCRGTARRARPGNHTIGDLEVNDLARSGDQREQSDSGGSVFGKGGSLPVGARHAVPARGNTSIQVQATHASPIRVGGG